ncbi:MAG: FHA domain-containing protein [Deltaproteobacteria bacterium]|nr:FHA domain-containing protein [Deltaproteobacteria bacterium]
MIDSVVMIGRDASCQIRGEALGLAPTHCRIVRHGGVYRAEHLAGTPTLVNGVSISARSRVLADGDQIDCAGFTLRFVARTSSPTLPRADAETQRLPIAMARQLAGPSKAELEREVAELRAEVARLTDENRRLRGA